MNNYCQHCKAETITNGVCSQCGGVSGIQATSVTSYTWDTQGGTVTKSVKSQAQEVTNIPPGTAVVKSWLLTLPDHHPLWDHYSLSVITLAEIPGVPAPVIAVPGATHEILLLALDPNSTPQPDNPESFVYLTPVNYAIQVQLESDTPAIRAGQALVDALLRGYLWAEFQGVQGMKERYDRVVQTAIKEG